MTIIGAPVGYVVSYLLLWLYFHLDSGYFTQVNVQFVYQVNVVCKNLQFELIFSIS